MSKDFLTLDDVEVGDKTVFLRLDINSPIDPETGHILDDSRFRASMPTLKDLRDARVIVGSHQSRPGKSDFTSLESHTAILRRYHGRGVKFIEDVIGPAALESIKKLERGEVLVLDNLRLCSEEVIEAPAKEAVKTLFIRRLAPLFDLFVNDAFAASHRSQPSLVGFAELMPAAAGRTMEKELKVLGTALHNPKRPCVYVLGGVKIEDRIPVIENVLKTGKTDIVLLGGLLGEFFLQAQGYSLGTLNEERLGEYSGYLKRAKKLLETYKDKLQLPRDLAFNRNGERVETRVKDLPAEGLIMDIGIDTIATYCTAIKNAGTAIADGPQGVFEEEAFSLGTKEILLTMAESNATTVVGGGHAGGAAEILGLSNKLSHISTGGGAMLAYLSGQSLPALEALSRAAKRFGKT